jgi:hypothetical protein
MTRFHPTKILAVAKSSVPTLALEKVAAASVEGPIRDCYSSSLAYPEKVWVE